MAERGEIYKCELCGNLVVCMHGGKGALVCCDQDMVLLEVNTVDAALEKHVPVVNVDGCRVDVQVGSTPHPMENDHYIEWICLHTENDEVYTKFLKPGDAPEATFTTDSLVAFAQAYCNQHGLWKSK